MKTKIQIATPSSQFQPYIVFYKYFESELTRVYKIIPNSYVELYFNFTPIQIFSKSYYNLDNPKIHLVSLTQPDQNVYTDNFGTARNRGFIIVFKPLGFCHLFNIKQTEFYKYTISREFVFTRDIYYLWEQLQEFNEIEDIKQLVECYLLIYAVQASCASSLMNNIVSYMDKSHGLNKVKQICNLFNITPRTLERRFKNEIGMSPNKLRLSFRINHAIHRINEQPICSLTEISYSSGYYDQSHFIKDVRKIAGMSPKHLRRREVIKSASRHFNIYKKRLKYPSYSESSNNVAFLQLFAQGIA